MSEFLEVRGARTHNLKNIDVKIPKNTLTVITWLSGSGKSSLAFSTIYSIWQQKYLESLSSYARMFVWSGKDEAVYDEILWLSPTISIDQKTTNRNPRSTVGTITEIYDYYKLLFLNLWERKCVDCGHTIKKDTLRDIIDYISKFKEGVRFYISCPFLTGDINLTKEKIKKQVLDAGFIRFTINGQEYNINSDFSLPERENLKIEIIIDRLVVKDFTTPDSSDTKRLKDSIAVAYRNGGGQLSVYILEQIEEIKDFSEVFICSNCGHIPSPLTISSFSFNSHHGACWDCHGLGEKMVFLESAVTNQKLTLEEGAILPPGFGNYFLALLVAVSKKYNLRLNVEYSQLTQKEKDIVMLGTWNTQYTVSFVNEQGKKNTYNSKFEWVLNTLTRRYYDGWVEHGNYEDYVTNMECPSCQWYRLSREPLSVFLGGKHIGQVTHLNVRDSLSFFSHIEFTTQEKKISNKVLKNICERLDFLSGVGLSYMTLARRANTLSWWEAQRIRLATQIWVKLEGIIYVLDEPSIWLHPRDNDMLIENLKKLRDVWNTLIVVEHDEDIMRASDHIIDIWPGAWIHGGNVISQWSFDEVCADKNSVTWPYLSGEKTVVVERKKRKIWKTLSIRWAKHHNLKNIDVDFPIGQLSVITGVSGSGKSSLIKDIVASYLLNTLNRASRPVWLHDSISWIENFDKALVIDQSPIWKTPRSNPATYTGVFTFIREVFSSSYDAKLRWYAPGRFSFNTREWRCPECDGDGVKKIEMHFLPPVYTTCEACDGKRFNPETLEIKYKGKTIAEILSMTVEEARDFFHAHPRIMKVLEVLDRVGLWYIGLWQSSITLSWWEAQRIKLATELSKRSSSKTIYILDEPTTGLHFQDIEKLLHILHTLVDKWNTVLVIEHNMNIIMNADYIVDIGPEWWDEWGGLVVAWDIQKVKDCQESYTGKAIINYEKNFKK